MKITVFACDLPYPPNSGGRLDLWTQLCALASGGYKIQLWCFSDSEPESDFFEILQAKGINQVHCLPFSGVWRDARSTCAFVSLLWRKAFSPVPSCCSHTYLSSSKLSAVVAAMRDFAPDYILAHGIQTFGAVSQVRNSFISVPLLYRSQNHETLYYKSLVQAQPLGPKKAYLLWQKTRLSWYEPYMIHQAKVVLHISCTEQSEFEKRGYHNQLWVPPVYEFQTTSPLGIHRWDIGILSSWFVSHKIEGLKWFIDEVRPWLPKDLTIAIAGSGAPDWLPSWCAKKNITFIGQVTSVNEFYSNCRTLANPILRGAGVNMKTMEMLYTNRPVITTRAGLAGLPPEVFKWVYIGDTARDFASAIIRAKSTPIREIPATVFAPFTQGFFTSKFSEALRLAKI